MFKIAFSDMNKLCLIDSNMIYDDLCVYFIH